MDPKATYESVMAEVKKHIAGNAEALELMFIALVADGNVLMEGVPGLAKTTMTKALADAIDAKFNRVEGTSDLMPRDIIGYTYLDENHEVQLKKGPIFTNLLLIDELNRAPPTTTTALLEALEERRVTIGTYDMALERPFITFATQNPLNIEGTTPLPKVLSDRFIMRIGVTYADKAEEVEMLRMKEREHASEPAKKVVSIAQILELQSAANSITISDEVLRYITEIVTATRTEIHVVMGASPRAEIGFLRASKAKALIEGRKEVTHDDIRALAKPILSHRLSVKSTGGLGVNGIIDGILATVR